MLTIRDVPPKESKLVPSFNGTFIGVHNIKKEQEEMWSSQEGEQLPKVERFPFSCVPSKSDSQEAQENVPYILKGKFTFHLYVQKCFTKT